MNLKKISGLIASILALSVLTLSVGTFAAISISTTLNSSGTIIAASGLSLYSDSACTVPLPTLSWGLITPGNSITNMVYVKNTGGSALTLSMTTSNWNPASANGPLIISWTKSGTTLSPGQSTASPITLTASSSISTISSFNVQIVISGTG